VIHVEENVARSKVQSLLGGGTMRNIRQGGLSPRRETNLESLEHDHEFRSYKEVYQLLSLNVSMDLQMP
jgi:hypothetical protein